MACLLKESEGEGRSARETYNLTQTPGPPKGGWASGLCLGAWRGILPRGKTRRVQGDALPVEKNSKLQREGKVGCCQGRSDYPSKKERMGPVMHMWERMLALNVGWELSLNKSTERLLESLLASSKGKAGGGLLRFMETEFSSRSYKEGAVARRRASLHEKREKPGSIYKNACN